MKQNGIVFRYISIEEKIFQKCKIFVSFLQEKRKDGRVKYW